jgi:hypothetical protein
VEFLDGQQFCRSHDKELNRTRRLTALKWDARSASASIGVIAVKRRSSSVAEAAAVAAQRAETLRRLSRRHAYFQRFRPFKGFGRHRSEARGIRQ